MIRSQLLGAAEAQARLAAIPDAVNTSLARSIASLGTELRQRVQERLGGRPLEPRSGRLRSSIDLEIEATDTTCTAIVSSALGYARAQEFGFEGVVSVRMSLRRIKEAFGRPIAEKIVTVRACRTRQDLPARSFLGSALDEMSPDIPTEVEAALREAISP